MNSTQSDGLHPGQSRTGRRKSWPFARLRCFLTGLAAGVVLMGWAAGGTERYGEADGLTGHVRGAYRTLLKGFRYTSASVNDSYKEGSSSVRNLGLGQQIETRLCQDKRIDAAGIIVEVEEDGTTVLRGIVTSPAHKDTAVNLVRETRGVDRVVDRLAVPPRARVLDSPEGESVPTRDAKHPISL